jgi:hypothetical protein
MKTKLVFGNVQHVQLIVRYVQIILYVQSVQPIIIYTIKLVWQIAQILSMEIKLLFGNVKHVQ